MRTILGLAAIVILATLNLGGGCASDNQNEHRADPDQPNRIPESADMVAEGHEKVKWTADMDGTVWIFDKDKNNIRYTGPVRRGDEIILQPDRDKIYIGGHNVHQGNLEKHSWHKIYFVPEGGYQHQVPPQPPPEREVR
jgi:hypothetical protein